MNTQQMGLEEKKKHGDLFFPFTVYRPTLGEWEDTLFAHWHKEMEISYIAKGEAVYTVDFTDYPVKQGDVLLIPPESLHSGMACPGIASENMTLIFDLSMLDASQIDHCTSSYIAPLQKGELHVIRHIPNAVERCPELVETIARIGDLFAQRAPWHELQIKSAAFHLLYLLYQGQFIRSSRQAAPPTGNTAKIKAAIRYIDENYTRKLYISEIAGAVNYSPQYTSLLFKKATHMSCVEYINRVRIHKAAELLIQEDRSVADTAMDVGFDNISYFIKKFHQVYGLSPHAYRKELRRISQ